VADAARKEILQLPSRDGTIVLLKKFDDNLLAKLSKRAGK